MMAYYHYRYLLYLPFFELKDKRCKTEKKFISINFVLRQARANWDRPTGQPSHPVHLNISWHECLYEWFVEYSLKFQFKEKWIENDDEWYMIMQFSSGTREYYYYHLSGTGWAECKIIKKHNLILKSTQVLDQLFVLWSLSGLLKLIKINIIAFMFKNND